MTTKRVYHCNFCNAIEDRDQIHGLYWKQDDRLEKRPAVQCESHLCQRCLNAIAEIGDEYASVRPVKGEVLDEQDEC